MFTFFDGSRAAPGQPELLVNTATLNLYIRVRDLDFGGGLGLSLERSFNLDDTRPGPFGNRWAFNLGESLAIDGESGSVTLRRAGGRVDVFAPAAEPGRFFAVTETQDLLALNPDGTYRLGLAHSRAVHTFAADGRLLSVDDGALRRLTLDYDGSGRLAAARASGRRIAFAWNESGRISAVSDSAGRNLAFLYNPDGSLALQINPDGQPVLYQYDGNGLLSAITTASGTTTLGYSQDGEFTAIASITFPDGTIRQYEAIAPGQVRVAGGASITAVYAYTAAGLLESVTSSSGSRTSYAYDAAGRRTKATLPGGGTVRFDYDTAGNLASVTDAGGNRWTADFNAAGDPLRLADANGNAYLLRYDAGGNLIGYTDPLGGTWSAERDAAGRITSLIDPGGNRRVFEYDDDGLLARVIDALGAARTWQYDGAARPSARTEPGGGTVNLEYGTGVRPVAARAGDTRTALEPLVARDAFHRVTVSVDSFGNVLQYSYDSAGRPAGLALPPGAVTYEYDLSGRLFKVADWLGNFAVYSYDAAGAVAGITVSGGPITLYQRDASGRLTAVVSTGPDGNVAAAWRYTLDANGNRVAAGALEPVAALPAMASGSMVYDAAGHIMVRSDGLAFRYDDSGRLVGVDGPRAAALAYDPFGRLASFSIDGSSAAYTYDAAGLRVERTSGGSTRRWIYDLSRAHPRPVMETDGDGNPVAYYVYGLGLLWKIDAAGKTWFYHVDGNGNVAAVSDPAAGVVNRYRYDPLGVLASAEESVENPFRAHGEAGWVDDGNGLLYGAGAFRWPEMRTTLPGTIESVPPLPNLLPLFSGPAACLVEGPAWCGLTAGRREP